MIKRKFWFRDKGKVQLAFSYDKDFQATQFANKWGGHVLEFLEVPPEIDELQSDQFEIYSVILNDLVEELPTSEAENRKRFKVLVWDQGEFREYDNGHVFLKQANDVAKSASAYYSKVIVGRVRVND